MKLKILFLIATVLFVQNVFAQEKLDTIAVENNKNAVSYKLILEYGMSSGINRSYYKGENIEEIQTFPSLLGLSLSAINNIAFNDRFLLGIGCGLEYRSLFIAFPKELAGMCFLNFRYYFNKPEKIVRPMLNIAMGGRVVKDFDGIFVSNPETMYGVYGTLGAGFKVKIISLQGGVLFWTEGNNLYGVDAMVRVGLTF